MADPYLAVEYTMYGAREAMNGGMPHIEQHIVGIERAIVENPGYAFDLAKALVESVCKVILDERSVTYASGDDLPQLFGAVTLNLPLLPASASGETQARNSLQKTLNGLHTAIQGICELRNNYGFASHGTSRHGQVMESVQALLAAQAADSIVGFLHQVHAQDRARLPAANLEHRHNPEFNDYVGYDKTTKTGAWGVPSQASTELGKERFDNALLGHHEYGDFKIAVLNESGQELAVSVKYRTADIPVAS